MSLKLNYYADLHGIQLNEQNQSWIHAMRPGEYQHPQHGKLDLNFERLRKLAEGVKTKVRGIDLDIDYDHKQDVAQGSKAAGWVKDAEVRVDGLWLMVEWTEAAAKSIKDKEYKYFSPEFWTDWTDAAGTAHSDVLMGGGITNRPFLKNLVPINLSELVFDKPTNPTPPPEGGKQMDTVKMAKILGLAETATEDEILVALAERFKAPTPPAPPAPAPVTHLALSEDMIKLAETNASAKAMVELFEAVTAQNAKHAVSLKEQAIAVQLKEFDSAKIAVTPVTRDLIHDIAISLNEELSPKFWELLKTMRDGHSFVVELGERGSAGVQYKRERSAGDTMDERIKYYMSDEGGKLSFADAAERASADNPGLYNSYRSEKYIAGGRAE